MKLIFTFFFSSFVFLSFGQLDSASIISINDVVINSTDSLGNTSQDTLIEIQVAINDFDFFGEIVTSFKDQASQYPLYMVKYTKQEIIELNAYNSTTNSILLRLPKFSQSGVIDIQIIVRNYQGANLPIINTTFSN